MKSKKRFGFTLTEVVIAVVILTMVMIGAYELVWRSGRLSQAARNHYVAIHLAQNRMERARTMPYSSLNLMAESMLVVNENGVSDWYGNYRRTTLITTNYAPNLTKVEVNVEIKDSKTGQWKGAHETISTLLTEYVQRP